MALTEFQRTFAQQRGLDQIYTEAELTALASVLPKNVEAAAHRQGYVSYLIAFAIVGYLKRNDFSNADTILIGLREQIASDQRGPYKLTLQYLTAFNLLTAEETTFNRDSSGSQLIEVGFELKKRMKETKESFEQIQGDTLDLFDDPIVIDALIADLLLTGQQKI